VPNTRKSPITAMASEVAAHPARSNSGGPTSGVRSRSRGDTRQLLIDSAAAEFNSAAAEFNEVAILKSLLQASTPNDALADAIAGGEF